MGQIFTFCRVSSCRPLSNKIGFTRFGLHLQKLWQFRFYCLNLVRKNTGDGPESPPQRTRNLWSIVFRCQVTFCGAVLDRGPELHRRNTGVFGLAGVSGPLDRNLWPAPMIQQARRLTGISSPGRSLRPTYSGVSGLHRL